MKCMNSRYEMKCMKSNEVYTNVYASLEWQWIGPHELTHRLEAMTHTSFPYPFPFHTYSYMLYGIVHPFIFIHYSFDIQRFMLSELLNLKRKWIREGIFNFLIKYTYQSTPIVHFRMNNNTFFSNMCTGAQTGWRKAKQKMIVLEKYFRAVKNEQIQRSRIKKRVK